jgi:CRP-like cAMP-binding protein
VTDQKGPLPADLAPSSSAPRRPAAGAADEAVDELDESALHRGTEALASEAAQARRLSAHQRQVQTRLTAEQRRLCGTQSALVEAAQRTLASRRRAETIDVLREDPELAAGLSAQDRNAATELLRAPVLVVDGPVWEPPQLDADVTFGLLILNGIIARRLRVRQATSLELLGAGEILRPWDYRALGDVVSAELEWTVLEPARLAILDERVTALIGRWPQLTVAFSGRILERARSAELLTAVSHLPRVDERLLATLWHLASRWGKVTPEGVTLPLRLTHRTLGEIVGARRPSVTLALQRLEEDGKLRRGRRGHYVLIGAMPGPFGTD